MGLRRRSGAVALVVTAVLALSACSSNGSSNSSTSPSSTSSSSASSGGPATGDPIVVGAVCDCSGPLAANQGVLTQVFDSWMQATNASGGLNGHPVKLIVKDDALTPAKSLQAVKELVETDKVVAIINMSNVDATWQSYIEGSGVPVVGGNTSEDTYLKSPDFFPASSESVMQNIGTILAAKAAGITKLGALYCAEAPVCKAYDAQLSAIAKTEGITYTSASISATQPSYVAQCQVMKNAGVTGLALLHAGAINQKVMDNCATIGFKPTPMTEMGSFALSFLKDPNMAGMLYVSGNVNFTDQSNAQVKAMYDALNKYASGTTTGSGWNDVVSYAWAGLALMTKVAQSASLTPTSTPADVKKGLYALKDETLQGYSPTLNFTEGKPSFPPCFFTSKVDSAGLTSLNGGAATCPSDADIQKYRAAAGA